MSLKKSAPAFAIIASLILSGCVTTQGSQGNDAALTPDQRALRDFSAEYTGTGAVAGAIAGCALGALVSKNDRGSGCLVGAAAGGALGAGGGYYLAQRQKEAGTQGVSLATERSELDREVAAMQHQTAVINRVTQQTQQEVQALARQVASGQASREQLESRLKMERDTLRVMVDVQKRLKGTIEKLEIDIREKRGSRQDIALLKSRLAELKSKDQGLRQDIDTMLGLGVVY